MCVPGGREGRAVFLLDPCPWGAGPSWDWGGHSECLEVCPGVGAAGSPAQGRLGAPSCLLAGGQDSRSSGAYVANWDGSSPQAVADLRQAFDQGRDLGPRGHRRSGDACELRKQNASCTVRAREPRDSDGDGRCFGQLPRLGTPRWGAGFPELSVCAAGGTGRTVAFLSFFLERRIGPSARLTHKFFLSKSLGPTSPPSSCPGAPGNCAPHQAGLHPQTEPGRLVLESQHVTRRDRIWPEKQSSGVISFLSFLLLSKPLLPHPPRTTPTSHLPFLFPHHSVPASPSGYTWTGT